MSRDERVYHETSYFIHALERLGTEAVESNFIIFTRFLRRYGHSTFHLIDQARFSLGDSMARKERTVQHAPLAAEARCALPAKPLRILLHFSGTGWAIKTYPRHYSAALCRALVGLGCELSVIGDPGLEEFGVRSIVCDDVASLTQAVHDHHIFIGVDSFPHHFVRHVMGWPTIGLFGNTKTCNSDAAGGASYQAVTNNLPCNPCGGKDNCPVFGGTNCQNYLEPGPLAATILEMAQAVYGYAL
jgi:ADP-heptose:LPS heptosyltransferase